MYAYTGGVCNNCSGDWLVGKLDGSGGEKYEVIQKRSVKVGGGEAEDLGYYFQ
jgi:hypothetical protein